jgi:hypothetical protein
MVMTAKIRRKYGFNTLKKTPFKTIRPIDHNELVIKAKEQLLKDKIDIEAIIVNPLPDIILIDWKNRKISAVEVSHCEQEKEKTLNYCKSDFKSILFMKARRRRVHPTNRPKFKIKTIERK